MQKKIDLMIVGAQKAGTTSLLRYLGEHPSCISHPQKEFAYFLNDSDYNGDYNLAFVKYFSTQSTKNKSVLIAKSATLYANELAIQRLYQHNPKCQVLLILRNPIERTYSSYVMEKNAGSIAYNFDEITNVIQQKSGWEYELFIDNSLYSKHLKKIYKYFPADQVTFILFDDLKKTPISICKDVFRTLQIDPEFIPAIEVRHNSTRINRSFGYAKTVNKILHNNSTFRKFASHIIPSYKSYKFGNFIRELNKSNETYQPMSEETKKILFDFYKPYNDELSKLLNKDLSVWNSH
jgi:hypothetical protein